MHPLVSLIIPCHNAAVHLDATLASVTNQTLRNFECIIINDGSTDTSWDIITHWRRRETRFHAIEHRVNAGISAARNTGLRAARGTFIAFLNPGDILTPRSLESRARTCLSAVAISDRFAGSYAGGCKTALPMSDIGFVRIGGKSPFNSSQPMVRTELLRQFGGFCETIKLPEDYEFWYRLMRAGYWFLPTGTVTIGYGERNGSPRHTRDAPALLHHANTPLPESHLSRAPYRLTTPYSDYARQLAALDHIGTALATEDETHRADITPICHTEAPDAPDLITPGTSSLRPVLVRTPYTQGYPPEESIEPANHLTAMLQQQPHRQTSRPDVQISSSSEQAFLNRHWNSYRTAQVKIAFFPHKDYHVWTIGLIAKALRQQNIDFLTIDISPQWGEAGIQSSAVANEVELIGLGEYVLGDYNTSLIVVFNDWDHVTRPIVVAANAAGLSTAAIVEGIQDYHDIDTGGHRSAYGAVRHVLLPGDFDRRYFSTGTDQTIYSVGVPRIQALRNAPKPASAASQDNAKPRVLINSNFSYGVLTEHRDTWLQGAVSAVRAAGMTPIISRHPADKGTLFPSLVSDTDFYSLLEECQITIQRFASGILEAIARDKVVLYFNPHGEKVDKFTTDPMNVYPIVTSEDDLIRQLTDWHQWKARVKADGPAFLDLHSGPAASDSIQQAADILATIARRQVTASQRQCFSDHLRTIDERTKALCHAVLSGQPLFSRLDDAITQLRRMTASRLQDIADTVGLSDITRLRTHREALAEHARMLADISKARATTGVKGESDDLLSFLSRNDRGKSLLRACMSALLLDPESTMRRLRNDNFFASAINHALRQLPPDDALAVQFQHVKDHAMRSPVRSNPA